MGPDDADDAWSETFLAALRNYPDLDPSANMEAWLVTIAHRKAIDIIRSKSRLERLESQSADQIDGISSTFGDPLRAFQEKELWERVLALPFRQRQAVAYHFLGGLPYRDVADLIGGSVDSVRRAASDGVARLREIFVNDGESSSKQDSRAKQRIKL